MQVKKPVEEEMNFFYNDTVIIISDTEEKGFEDKVNFYGGSFGTVEDFNRIDGKLYYQVRIDDDKTIIVPQDCLVDADDIFEDEDCCCDDCCCEDCHCDDCCCELEGEDEYFLEDIHRCPDCGAIICPYCGEAF